MIEVRRVHKTPADAKIQHLVIGHSQIMDCWKIKMTDDKLKLPMDYICVEGGKLEDLIFYIEESVVNAVVPLRITGVIWQIAIHDISLTRAHAVISYLENFMQDFPDHQLALPTCQFAPELHESFDKIARLNIMLDDYNTRQGFTKYSLHKSTIPSFKVKPSLWKEFNEGKGLGRTIEDKSKYTSFIQKFHNYGFRKEGQSKPAKSNINIGKILDIPVRIPQFTVPKPVEDLRSKLSRKDDSRTDQSSMSQDLRSKLQQSTSTISADHSKNGNKQAEKISARACRDRDDHVSIPMSKERSNQGS